MKFITIIQCQVVGAIALFVVLWNLYGITRKSKVWVPVKGRLIGYEVCIETNEYSYRLGRHGQEIHYPRYEYSDGNGNKYVHLALSGFYKNYPPIGTIRKLYYNENCPSETSESKQRRNELNYLGVVFGGIILTTIVYLYSTLI